MGLLVLQQWVAQEEAGRLCPRCLLAVVTHAMVELWHAPCEVSVYPQRIPPLHGAGNSFSIERKLLAAVGTEDGARCVLASLHLWRAQWVDAGHPWASGRPLLGRGDPSR